jgi:hypothetical protein
MIELTVTTLGPTAWATAATSISDGEPSIGVELELRASS